MNALWITRMAAYKNSSLCVESAKQLIRIKIERQSALLKKYKTPGIEADFGHAQTIAAVSLEEARAAKRYWHSFRSLIPVYASFAGRRPHAQDIGNRLLDIGYHHLTNIVKKLLEKHDISSTLGLLHVARLSDSAPLAYDLIELFRADIVDAEVLRFLRLKKKPLRSVEKELSHFLHEINERLERHYYLKDFRQCHTYRYYMELQILKCISAVNHRKPFDLLHLPTRHDSRCECLTFKDDMVVSL
jgi:CRISPR-associated endonuclease Cas1